MNICPHVQTLESPLSMSFFPHTLVPKALYIRPCKPAKDTCWTMSGWNWHPGVRTRAFGGGLSLPSPPLVFLSPTGGREAGPSCPLCETHWLVSCLQSFQVQLSCLIYEYRLHEISIRQYMISVMRQTEDIRWQLGGHFLFLPAHIDSPPLSIGMAPMHRGERRMIIYVIHRERNCLIPFALFKLVNKCLHHLEVEFASPI